MTPIKSSSCIPSIDRPLVTLVDENSQVCLALDVARRLTSEDVLERLAWLSVTRGVPAHIRSDNGSEHRAAAVHSRLRRVGVSTLYVKPGNQWENGCIESFNGRLRDDLLNGEMFYTLAKARILIEGWRRKYSTIRPPSSLGYRPAAGAADARRLTQTVVRRSPPCNGSSRMLA